MDHPLVKQIETFGYPLSKYREPIAFDFFHNECYVGDGVYELNDRLFLIEYLSREEIEILEHAGTTKRTLE